MKKRVIDDLGGIPKAPVRVERPVPLDAEDADAAAHGLKASTSTPIGGRPPLFVSPDTATYPKTILVVPPITDAAAIRSNSAKLAICHSLAYIPNPRLISTRIGDTKSRYASSTFALSVASQSHPSSRTAYAAKSDTAKTARSQSNRYRFLTCIICCGYRTSH